MRVENKGNKAKVSFHSLPVLVAPPPISQLLFDPVAPPPAVSPGLICPCGPTSCSSDLDIDAEGLFVKKSRSSMAFLARGKVTEVRQWPGHVTVM